MSASSSKSGAALLVLCLPGKPLYFNQYKCDFDFMQQFNKQEVNIKRLVLDTIFPAFALFIQQK